MVRVLEMEAGFPNLEQLNRRSAMSVSTTRLAAFLSRTEYFARCTPEEISTVIDIFDTVKLNSGAYLFEEGDRGDAWYMVLEGEVAVVKAGDSGPPHTLAQLDAGEGFGEMALIDDAPRMGSVYAMEPTLVVRLSRERFISMLRSNNPIVIKVLWAMAGVLCKRQRELTYILQELVDDPGPQQVSDPTAMADLLQASFRLNG
jgi:CRP-like cAMP-binding protein